MADIHGICSEEFVGVREVLARNLDSGADSGASAAVFIDGEPVVDIWGGYFDEARTWPWKRDTIINAFSTTKTMTVLCALILADRGELRVVALTAGADPTTRARALEAGAAEVLSTAAGLEEIVEAVKRLEAPNLPQEWELSDALRSALLGIALRPERSPHESLRGPKRHVERALWELCAIERQRELSDEERCQEAALRDLLTAIEEAERG